jgi:hypothetical protein
MKIAKEQGEEKGYMCIQSIVQSHTEVKRYVCTQSIVKSHEEEKEDTISSSSHVHTSHIDIQNSRLHNTQ